MSCERCRTAVKDWEGADRKCAFNAGVFSSDNWNCATMAELRDLAQPGALWNEDQYAAVLRLGNCSGFIVLSWYKRRGRTEGAWFMTEDTVRPLALTEAIEVIEAERRDGT